MSATSPILELATGYILARALHVVDELRIIHLLRDQPRSAASLARATGVDETSLARVMRCLVALEVLTEQHGVFSAGPAGDFLRADGPEAAAIRMVANDDMWHAFQDLRETVRTGLPALRQHRAGPMYRPGRGAVAATRVAMAMRGFHQGEPEEITRSCSLDGHRLAVDVGGGSGSLLTAILEANDGLSGVVFDLPDVAAAAEGHIAERMLGRRCRFEGGSFFETPPPAGDLYILSHVLHDWSDADASMILKNCRRGLEPGGQLLILEIVRGEQDLDLWSGIYDLILLSATEGRLRSAKEHAALLERAGFRLNEVVATSLAISIIKASPA
jgi:hypothetical protein